MSMASLCAFLFSMENVVARIPGIATRMIINVVFHHHHEPEETRPNFLRIVSRAA